MYKTVGSVDRDGHVLAGAVLGPCDRQIGKIRVWVFLLLIPCFIQKLMKVALPVEQTDPDYGQSKIGSRF